MQSRALPVPVAERIISGKITKKPDQSFTHSVRGFNAHDRGEQMSVLELEERPISGADTPVKTARPVTFWTIALAVLVGNVLSAILGAIVYVAVTH